MAVFGKNYTYAEESYADVILQVLIRNRMRELLLATVLLSIVSSEDFKTEKHYSSVSEGNPEFWPVRGRRTFWNAFRPNLNPLDKSGEYRRIFEPSFFLRDPAQKTSPIAFIRYLDRVEPWPNDVDEFANSERREITSRRRKPSFRMSYEFNELTGDSERHKYSSSGRDRRNSQNWKRQEPLYVEEPHWIKIDTNYDALDRVTNEDRPIFVTSQGKKVCRFKEIKEVIDRFDDYYPDSFFSVRGRRNFALTKLKKLLGDKNISKYLIENKRVSKMDARHDNRIEDETSELETMKSKIGTQDRKESNGLENIEDPFVSLRSERSVDKNVIRSWENVTKDPERAVTSRKSKEVADDNFAKMTMSNGSKNDEEQSVVQRQRRSVRNDEMEKSSDPISTTNDFEEDEVDDEEDDEEVEKAREKEGNFEARLDRKRTDRRISGINRCEISRKRRGKAIDRLRQTFGNYPQTPLMLVLRRKRSNLIYEDETKKDVKKCSRSMIDDRRKEAVRPGERSIVDKEGFGYVHPRNKHFSITNAHEDEPFFISRGKKSSTDLHGGNIGILENELIEENDRYTSGSSGLLFNRRETSTGLEERLKCEGSF